VLGIAASTLLRWFNDGFVTGEQLIPDVPWRIRLTDELRSLVINDAPDGWLALHHASRTLGVTHQTVLHKVKRGELRAVITRTGRRKGLRIEVSTPKAPCSKPDDQPRSSVTMPPTCGDVGLVSSWPPAISSDTGWLEHRPACGPDPPPLVALATSNGQPHR
jgi:hypothetical protein